MTDKHTIVGKALEAILSIFKSNWKSFVKKLFTKIPKEVLAKVTIAVYAIEALKKWLASDKAKKIVDFIPGEVDNDILYFVNGFLSDYDFTGILELLPKDSHNIATTLTSELTGLSFGQSALTTEVVYQNLKADGKLD